MQGEVLACQEKTMPFIKVTCRGDVENGSAPRESAESASRRYCAHREAKIEKTDGSSSRHERVGIALLVLGGDLEVYEELSTLVSPAWAEGEWIGEWSAEQKESWRKQIFEVQTWRQVRGLAGAVMCETRDLGIK